MNRKNRLQIHLKRILQLGGQVGIGDCLLAAHEAPPPFLPKKVPPPRNVLVVPVVLITCMAECDEELMKRVGHGDLDAFQALYDRYYLRLFAFLCRCIHNATIAEDVVQDVFLRMWQNRSSFNGGNFSTWIYVIARRAALDECKRADTKTTPFSQLSESDQREVATKHLGEGQPGDLAERLALREMVTHALGQLPDEQRDAIIWRQYEELSYKEIGERLDCSVENARVLVYRARLKLRELLQPGQMR